MHICVVGGIFGRSVGYRTLHPHSPETVLASGLAARGYDVEAVGHDAFAPGDAYDVIHVHHVGRAAYLMAVSATRAPFVFTGHDGQMLCGYEGNPVRREAFRFVLQRSDVAVALSEEEARFLRGLGHPQVVVIPNGIATSYADVDLHGERRGLLYVGQLLPLKGVDVLVRALPLMRHAAAPLTLAYHNAHLEPELRALVAQLGLAHRVSFAGPRSPAQVARMYAASECVVLPSHAEALPSVITEALLAGTPVVASRVGGIPDQLQGFGRLVEPGDAAALAAALDAALDDPPDAARRQAMRDYAAARFGVAAMAARHAEVYERAAAAGPRPGVRGREPLATALRIAIAAYWRRPRLRALRRG